jgi:hypothetical protein
VARAKKKKRQKASPLTKAAFEAPASYLADGATMATLRQVADPTIPTKNLVELSLDERVALVLRRLESQPAEFTVAIFGVGLIDKHRALYEVRTRSPIGRNLIEIEQRLIVHETRLATSK